MGRRKMNMFPWLAGLAAGLTALSLIVGVGHSYARYKESRSESIFYTPGQPAQIYLGQMVAGEEGKILFDSRVQSDWETLEGKHQLSFAVANGPSQEDFAQQNQQVQIRLAGTLGVWDGQQTVNMTMAVSQQIAEEQTLQTTEYLGQASRIQPESPLYSTFGDGWVFTFVDEEGQEGQWLLDGGTLTNLQITITIEGVGLTDPSLLQLTAIGSYLPDEG